MSIFEKIKVFFNKSNENHNFPELNFRIKDTGAVFEYSYMMSFREKDYPKYLSIAYFVRFLKKLNLKHPKTINEKIQWLKIYDNTPIKTQLTDKIAVRSWIEEKIGSQWLKPVLWTGYDFSDIPFDDLPESFIIKANHGCKWNSIVTSKSKLLNNNIVFEYTKKYVNVWLSANYFGLSDFETQYKDIIPLIFIEPFLSNDNHQTPKEYEIWCFNSEPKIFQMMEYDKLKQRRVVSSFNDNFENIDLDFMNTFERVYSKPDELLKKAVELSKILAKDFKLVRIDWLVHDEKLYFNEMTFTPHSGFIVFSDERKDWNLKLGKMLNLKGK